MSENGHKTAEKGVVTMGMVDSKIALNPYFFMIDLDGDIFSQIRQERVFFLRMWLMHSEAMRTPEINLFFEVGEDEWLFVEEYGKSCRQLKRMILDNEMLHYPYVVRDCIVFAYEKATVAMQENLFEREKETFKTRILPFCRKE